MSAVLFMASNIERKLCWRVTRRCNLCCIHCLAGDKNASRRDLTDAELEEALGKMIDAKISRITWSGGEPALCKVLPELLAQCHRHDISSVLTTHGLSLSPKIMASLRADIDVIRFSFDGLEKTHNEIRGGRFYLKTFEALRHMRQRGFNIEANISYMSRNAAEVPKLMELVQREGVSKIVLMSLMLRESAKINGMTKADIVQTQRLFGEVARFQERYPSTKVVINNYDIHSDRYIVVESDGEILLCSEALDDQSLGNIVAPDGGQKIRLALDQQTLNHRLIAVSGNR